MPTLTLPEGVHVELPEGEPVGAALPKGTIAARVDGELRDLSFVPADDAQVEPIAPHSDEGLHVLRHSTAHVLAQAVCDLFPGARYAIGPAVADGFYYDFELPEPVHAADLAKIDRRMRQIVKRNQRFVREEVPRDEALERLPTSLSRSRSSRASAATTTRRATRCRRRHRLAVLERWLGRPVHGSARAAHGHARRVQAHERRRRLLARRREEPPAHARSTAPRGRRRTISTPTCTDSRRPSAATTAQLGAELDLFSFPEEIGSGLAVFHPKGGLVRRLMEDYSRRRHEEAGYDFVYTPHITKSELFEISGHLSWFADGMFPPMELDGGTQYYLKPMNCPMHILIYKSRTRSYRELPLRLFEFGTVYRYELSGVVHGLTRVRGLTMDDAHIFTTKEQMGEELASVLTFVLDLLRDYGLDDFYMELSTRPEGKAVGTEEEWDEATEALRQAAETMDVRLVMDRGRRRLLRPEDQRAGARRDRSHVADVDDPGRLPAAAAVRDGVLGRRQRPAPAGHDPPSAVRLGRAVLRRAHRALRGRVPAVARARAAAVRAGRRPPRRRTARSSPPRRRLPGLRAFVDDSKESVGKKIRAAQLAKAPYTLVVGDQELESDAYTVRDRAGHRDRRASRSTGSSTLSSTEARAARSCRPTSDRPEAAHVDHLWSPWRMEYIETARDELEEDGGCVFCAVPTREPERVLARGELAYVVLNKFPYNPGHLLIVPLRHTGDVEDLTAEENAELQALLQRSIRALREESEPHGFNVGMNLGSTSPGPASPITCTGTSCRGGAATRTSCRWSARFGCCPSCSPTPPAGSPRGSPMPEGEDGSSTSRTGAGCTTRSPATAAPSSPCCTRGCGTRGRGTRSSNRGPSASGCCDTTSAATGGRRGPTARPYSHVRDLVALLDRSGLERTALVGCSMGGASRSTPR